ncbi:hypothetical protein S83_009854 [Arachis hypogaea]
MGLLLLILFFRSPVSFSTLIPSELSFMSQCYFAFRLAICKKLKNQFRGCCFCFGSTSFVAPKYSAPYPGCVPVPHISRKNLTEGLSHPTGGQVSMNYSSVWLVGVSA